MCCSALGNVASALQVSAESLPAVPGTWHVWFPQIPLSGQSLSLLHCSGSASDDRFGLHIQVTKYFTYSPNCAYKSSVQSQML